MAACAAATTALAACGGDNEPVASDPGRAVTETVTAPSPTPPDGSAVPDPGEPQGDPADGVPPGTADNREPAPGAPGPDASNDNCGDVTITPNSGDGAFDVRVTGIGCAEAEALIKDPDGLTTWDCGPAGGGGEAGGSQTIRCRDDGRTIVFETGV